MVISEYICRKRFKDMSSKNGKFFDAGRGITIIDHDADAYTDDGRLLFKFRKGVLNTRDTDRLMLLKGAATLGATRPDASGIPKEGKYKEIISKSSGKVLRVLTTKAHSGIVGFYDARSNFGYIHSNDEKCRITAFTARNLSKYQECLPVFRKIDRIFKGLVPEFHRLQMTAIKKLDPKFVIPGTAFTTVTVNRNFRTALHRDAGDFSDGFGNLVVCGDDDYKGAYTLFPQYGIGVDCRNGDFLAMNVHEWHCNSPLEGSGTRVSFIFYLREKMLRMCPKI